jgi:hypothetical protein
MKRHWILGVLWILGCGAGSPSLGGEDSTLESPLKSDDDASDDNTADDGSDDDLSDTELASEFIPNAGSDDATADDDAAPEASAEADDAPQAAAGEATMVVIGAGGEPWEQPADGVVVWCHASVPLGCPALEPAPNAGHIIVVQQSTETGEFQHDGPAGEGEISIVAGGASAPAPGTPPSAGAGPGTPSSGTAPAPGGPGSSGGSGPHFPGAPDAPVPVDMGGSLPPLPGTCVAIRFGGVGVAGGTSSDAAPVSVPDEPEAGAAPVSAPDGAVAGAPTPPYRPLPGIPALPPRGGCIGVGFPVPGQPGQPQPGHPQPGHPQPDEPPHGGGPISVPLPPAPGGCVSVAFATNDAAGASQTGTASAGAASDASGAAGLPFFCAAHPLPGAPPGTSYPGAPQPGAPLPPSAGGGGPIEVHQISDGVPVADEAADDEVR